MASDVKKLVDEAVRQGWRAEQGKSGKWKLYAPDGKTIVPVHSSPSDHRWLKNAVSLMRQAGFIWEGR